MGESTLSYSSLTFSLFRQRIWQNRTDMIMSCAWNFLSTYVYYVTSTISSLFFCCFSLHTHLFTKSKYHECDVSWVFGYMTQNILLIVRILSLLNIFNLYFQVDIDPIDRKRVLIFYLYSVNNYRENLIDIVHTTRWLMNDDVYQLKVINLPRVQLIQPNQPPPPPPPPLVQLFLRIKNYSLKQPNQHLVLRP